MELHAHLAARTRQLAAADGTVPHASALNGLSIDLVVSNGDHASETTRLSATRGVPHTNANPASFDGPASVTVTGSAAAWQRVLSGELAWPHATNALLGVLRVRGEAVVHAWAIPLLTQLAAPLAAPLGTPLATPRDAAEPAAATGIADTPEPVAFRADAAQAGITGHYVEVDGVQAYYEAVGAGPALLVLHTAGRDGRQWHPVMRELASTHRVFATDLPGHGKSWPRSLEWPCFDDIGEIADWLLNFMSAVGEERFLVAGTSVGGNLALLLAARSTRVRGSLALQGADHTPSISDTALGLMQHPRVSLQHSSMDQALELVGEGAVPEAAALIEWSIRELSPPTQQADLTAYTRTDTRHEMAAITCPVILVHGDGDWLATRAMVDAAASRIVNAPVSVVSLPGIGHYPHVEDPRATVRLVRQLTAEVLAHEATRA